jgi:hypothetical protein
MENMLQVNGIGDIFPRTTIFSKDSIFFRVLDFFKKLNFYLKTVEKVYLGHGRYFI